MTSVATLQPDPAPIVACTVSRDVQNFEILIDDMEAELGEAWGDLGFEDALVFLSQSDSAALEFVAIAVDADDEGDLSRVSDVIRKAKEKDVKVILVANEVSPMALHQLMRLGADDFVNKPFAIGELLARIRSALRRRASEPEPKPMVLETAGVLIDMARHHVTKRGGAIHLTPKEFDLLALLMRNPGKVLTQRYLLHEIWGPANVTDSQYLRVFIGQLRAKLEEIDKLI